MITHDNIRLVAKDYIRRFHPFEYPFFNRIWNQMKNPALSECSTVADKAPSRWWILLPVLDEMKSLWQRMNHLMVGGSITFLTPIVIATIETFALQKDGSVKIPKRPKLVYAIKQCARTLGASEKESAILSERLADRIEGLWLNSGGNALSPGAASTGTFPFMIWESDNHGVPLPVRKGDAEVISDILKGTKRHDIVIHGGLVTVRQSGRKSANVPCEGIMLNLLTLLIRYKNLELTARELYESAWRTGEGTPQASQLGNDEKSITANNLRAPLCRLRKGIAKKSAVKSFAIENVRSLGYRCEGAFTYCLILPAVDEPKTRIARLA